MRAGKTWLMAIALGGLVSAGGNNTPAMTCGANGSPCCATGDACQVGYVCGSGTCRTAQYCEISCSGRAACGEAADRAACLAVCLRQTEACQSVEAGLYACAGSSNCTIPQQQTACPTEFTAFVGACAMP